MTGLLAVLLLLSLDAGTHPGPPDGGAALPPPPARSAEDEEVIQKLDVLEHLADGQALEMMLELEAARARPDR